MARRRGFSPQELDQIRAIEPSTASAAALGAMGEALDQGWSVALRPETPRTEPVLTAIALTYLAHADPARVRLIHPTQGQGRLDERVVNVEGEDGLALRIFAGLTQAMVSRCPKARGGRCPWGCREGCLETVAHLGASDDPEAPQALHDYVRQGFVHGHRVKERWGDPTVTPALALDKTVRNEMERARQFVRFSKGADGLWSAVFRPKADVLPLVARHFQGRMGGEPFWMVDPVHGSLVLAKGDALELHTMEPGEAEALARQRHPGPDEPYVQALWKRFYEAVTIPGRDSTVRGYDLRGSFMPQRLWAYLPELDPRVEGAWETVPERYRGDPSPVAPADHSFDPSTVPGLEAPAHRVLGGRHSPTDTAGSSRDPGRGEA